MANSLKTHIENLLKTDERLIDENNEIRGSLIRELVNKLDENLIELLLTDEKARNTFFLHIKDVFVFKHNDFKFFLDENKIDNSYTQYENRIGLAVGSKMLNENQDVVLNFPYKDCVLEGGQSTEEGMDIYFEFDKEKAEYEEKQAKRKEVFFNEVLARDEIDRLFEPKAFTNIKKYTQKGVEIPTKFIRDENGVIKDNLIIKGNNLLALHSLMRIYKGGIKFIYLDPPYYFRENKLDDTFTYNSNFRLSSWLSFMKYRLLSAKGLMKIDGVIFISINEDGLCYLKVLLDEIFGIDNFVEIFSWKKTDTPSNLPNKSKKTLEYVLCYEHKKDNIKFKGREKTSSSNDPLTKPKNSFKVLEFKPSELICSDITKTYPKGTKYGTDKYPMELLNDLIIENNTNTNIVQFKNRFTWTQNYLEAELRSKTKIYCSKNTLVLSYKKQEYDLEAPFDLIDSTMGIQTSENAGKELTSMFGKEVFKYPKSESLMEYLINMIGNKFSKNDIVLDYHLGSGTTAAVAHKLGIRYIGIEQLSYINTLIIPRLCNVIKGDSIGISEKTIWKGGGSFVYMELAKNNEQAKELILECESYEELLNLFDVLYEEFFLHYNIRIKEFKEKVCKEENFIKLPLLKQKEMFCKMLDLNQMYVNVSEMEDKRYKLSASDISLTKDFYQIKD